MSFLNSISTDAALLRGFTKADQDRLAGLLQWWTSLSTPAKLSQAFDLVKFDEKGPRFEKGKAVSGDRVLMKWRLSLREVHMQGILEDFSEYVAGKSGGNKAGK